MRLSNLDLQFIEERASNLTERLAGKYMPTGADRDAAAQRLTRWRQLAGTGDPGKFAAVLNALEIAHLSESELLSLLGPVKRIPAALPLSWVSFLGVISGSLADAFDGPTEKIRVMLRPAGARQAVPYEHLYRPITELAWRHVGVCHSEAALLVSRKAQRDLRQHLLRRISDVASRALHLAFLAHKSVHQSGMSQQLFGVTHTAGGRELYESFVIEQGRDGLRAFFLRYPVAARLVAEVTLNWIEFVGEFIARAAQDSSQLSAHFNDAVPLGRVVSVKIGISDPHHRGRSVLLVTFAGDCQLAYKPRAMRVDQLFFELVGELNRNGMTPDLRALKILDLREYGWMEFARHEPCHDTRAARRYYQRAGMLTGLVHWLQAIDLHSDNVVASGEHPLLVDLETLAHPMPPVDKSAVTDTSSSWHIASSILRTGLLPLWLQRPAESGVYENSGLDGPVVQHSLLPTDSWKAVNTDQMEVQSAKLARRHPEHRLRVGILSLSIYAFAREVLSGFERITTFLKNQNLAHIASKREEIFKAARRRIKRPTLIYTALIRRSLARTLLAEGVDRSIALHALPCAVGEEKEWAEEIASMEILDVPHFRLDANTNATSPSKANQLTSPSLATHKKVVSLSLQRRLILQGELVRHRVLGDGKESRTRPRPSK